MLSVDPSECVGCVFYEFRHSFTHTCIHSPGQWVFAAYSTLGRAIRIASDAGWRSDSSSSGFPWAP